ncbi:hypothetical protein ACA910_021989 [Epithemia clementina (nom. ined.)]
METLDKFNLTRNPDLIWMTTNFEFFNKEDEDEDDANGVGEFRQIPKTSIADDVEILPVDEVGGDVEDLGKVEATDGDDEGDNDSVLLQTYGTS